LGQLGFEAALFGIGEAAALGGGVEAEVFGAGHLPLPY
jgi:hypothetical protein